MRGEYCIYSIYIAKETYRLMIFRIVQLIQATTFGMLEIYRILYKNDVSALQSLTAELMLFHIVYLLVLLIIMFVNKKFHVIRYTKHKYLEFVSNGADMLLFAAIMAFSMCNLEGGSPAYLEVSDFMFIYLPVNCAAKAIIRRIENAGKADSVEVPKGHSYYERD